MSAFKINITHIKILDTIFQLNKEYLYPNSIGVYKIVSGKEDDETKKYSTLTTFGTLISYNSKKISNLIVTLIRYGYIKRIYDEKSDSLFLSLTSLGEGIVVNTNKQRKKSYKQNKPKTDICIVQILPK